jgi:hypothetical protein
VPLQGGFDVSAQSNGTAPTTPIPHQRENHCKLMALLSFVKHNFIYERNTKRCSRVETMLYPGPKHYTFIEVLFSLKSSS